jgi:hypothetical protein
MLQVGSINGKRGVRERGENSNYLMTTDKDISQTFSATSVVEQKRRDV